MKFIFVLMLILSFCCGYSQDRIITTEKDTIYNCSVTLISGKVIEYNLDSNKLIIPKEQVNHIIFKSGEIEKFSDFNVAMDTIFTRSKDTITCIISRISQENIDYKTSGGVLKQIKPSSVKIIRFKNGDVEDYTINDRVEDKIIDSLKYEVSNRILDKVPNKYKGKIKELITEHVEEIVAITNSHKIVRDNDMNLYLQSIFKAVIPEELINNNNFRIFIVKDPEASASVYIDGSIFVNIGLIADVHSEDELAMVLAHEVSHHLQFHLVNRYINYLDKLVELGVYYDSNINVKTLKKLEHLTNVYSRSNESEADSLALGFIMNSEYNALLAIKIFNYFGKEELKYASKKGVYGYYATTHPLGIERYSSLKKQLDNYEIKDPKVNHDKFNFFRNSAKLMSLSLLHDYFRFDEALERALCYLTEDSLNVVYKYYILESIRRIEILNPSLINTPLFFHDYKITLTTPLSFKKKTNEVKVKESKNFLDIVFLERYDYNKLPLINDSIGIVSYKNLFDYFLHDSTIFEYPETYLSVGLYDLSTSNSTANLIKYTQQKGAQNIDYANYLINKSHGKSRNLQLFNELIVSTGYMTAKYLGSSNKNMSSERQAQLYENYEKTMSDYINNNVDYLQWLNIENVTDSLNTFDAIWGLYEVVYSDFKRNKGNYYMLDYLLVSPKIYQFMKLYGCRRIYFFELRINLIEEDIEYVQKIHSIDLLREHTPVFYAWEESLKVDSINTYSLFNEIKEKINRGYWKANSVHDRKVINE